MPYKGRLSTVIDGVAVGYVFALSSSFERFVETTAWSH